MAFPQGKYDIFSNPKKRFNERYQAKLRKAVEEFKQEKFRRRERIREERRYNG